MSCQEQTKSKGANQNQKSVTQMNTSQTENYKRQEIIYGRTYGTALTMEVFTPNKNANGLGIVLFASEGWYSDRDLVEKNIPIYIDSFTAKGYTVFAVVHGSNPKFSLLENVEHASRAVRFIRHNALVFSIDPNKIGATGDSAGGHLSLLMGSADENEHSVSEDPIDNESCKVQAVVAFFPPTDFLNWGENGNVMMGKHPKVPLIGAFTFYSSDTTTNAQKEITDKTKLLEIGRKLSPINSVNKSTSPTLIVYGDKDSFIPTQQSDILFQKLKDLGIPTYLIVEKGGEHDEVTIKHHISDATNWFDKYLKR